MSDKARRRNIPQQSEIVLHLHGVTRGWPGTTANKTSDTFSSSSASKLNVRELFVFRITIDY